jgi:hypothetical protein
VRKPHPLLIAAVLFGAAVVAMRFLPWFAPPPPFGASDLYVGPGDLDGLDGLDVRAVPPLAAPDAPTFWSRRFGDEVLVFGAEGGVPVEIRVEGGGATVSGRLDANGVLRVTSKVDIAFSDFVDIHADRERVRPGDRLRICARLTKVDDARDPIALLRFEPADAVVPSAAFRAADAPVPIPPPASRWAVLEVLVPDDVGPGKAVVECGNRRLALPLVPRWGPGAGKDDRRAGTPDAPPGTPPALSLSCRDGQWTAKAPFGTTSVLFFAEAGGRLLVHEGVPALDGTAAASLPLGEHPPAGARVTAIAATPKGFLETSAPVPGADGEIPVASDPVLAAFLASRPGDGLVGEIEIREGDEFTGPGRPLAVDGAHDRVMESVDVAVGKSFALFAEGRAAAPGSEVRWSTHPPGAEGALRIRAADGILLETRIDRDHSSGALPEGAIGDRTILVEAGAPGLKSVEFMWKPAARKRAPEAEPARPGEVLSVDRRFPAEGRKGDEVEYQILIHSKARGVLTVRCPLPAAAVPAEEGWQVRARSPAGTRVRLGWTEATFEVPAAGPGDVALTLKLRLERTGRVAVPAVEVEGRGFPESGPRTDSAWSVSSVLVVE